MILLLLILLISSCSKSEAITLPQTKSIDTCYTPRTKGSVRNEIRFDVSIIEWKENNTEL